MHKCMKCGTEFEGKFCPECGTAWQEKKTCPQCGAVLGGSAKFCNECGYAFYPSKFAAFKNKWAAICAWVKKHLKIIVPSALGLAFAIVMLSLIPTFIVASVNGTYYAYVNGEFFDDSYITLSTGKWTNGKLSGSYKVSGKKVTLIYRDKDMEALFGKDSEFAVQTIVGNVSNKVFAVQNGSQTAYYVRKDHRHKYGSAETVIAPTCTAGGISVKKCGCGLEETIDLAATGHYYGSWVVTEEPACGADGSRYHTCRDCGLEETEVIPATGHQWSVDNICTSCGYVLEYTEGLAYALNSNEKSYAVSGIGTASGDIILPYYYEGKPVTSIGERAFRSCSGLTSISIPDSVTSIGSYAFYNCSGLTSVTIGNGVTSIESSAFSYCSGLTSISVMDGNPVYHSEGNCLIETATKTLILGCKTSAIPKDESVTSIESSAFSYCSGLTSIVIPDSVTGIESSAFSYCSGLTSIVIPDSVTSIGSWAFEGCSSLTSIVIPDSVTSIGSSAFKGCSSLTSIVIPDSVTSIGSSAFYGCSGLTSVTIGNGVTGIESSAFYGCSGLTSVTIGNGVTSIGSSAFKGCSSLTSIVIPDSVTSIVCNAFDNTAYYNDEQNWENGVLYIGSHLIEAKTDIAGEYQIKNKTKTIAQQAFSYCSGLTSIIIPDSVTSIGSSAFYRCSSLTSIVIPDSVTSIGYGAFYNCSGLTSITIPDSVTSIGDRAFYKCSGLTSIVIPDSVTSIGSSAFEGCSGLTIYCEAESQPSEWNYMWNDSNCPVVWGYRGEE